MPGAIFGKCDEYMKLDRDKSTFKSHRDFSLRKRYPLNTFRVNIKMVPIRRTTT